MISIKFNGWFHSRIATDPDPADERRGISGMIKVFPGEPDLDRIIRFQPPTFKLRSYAPKVGVSVNKVIVGDSESQNHPLIGGQIDLVGSPMFKGENGIVAEDGSEPIIPFIFELKKDNARLMRTVENSAGYQRHPYLQLQANAFAKDPEAISSMTGIANIEQHLAQRGTLLERDMANESDVLQIEIYKRRINFLKSSGAKMFFPFYMGWGIPLKGSGEITIGNLKMKEKITLEQSWMVNMRLGGWDPDVMCGFVDGDLTVV